MPHLLQVTLIYLANKIQKENVKSPILFLVQNENGWRYCYFCLSSCLHLSTSSTDHSSKLGWSTLYFQHNPDNGNFINIVINTVLGCTTTLSAVSLSHQGNGLLELRNTQWCLKPIQWRTLWVLTDKVFKFMKCIWYVLLWQLLEIKVKYLVIL